MSAMIPFGAMRYWLSWLAFAGGVVALFAAAAFIPMIVDEFGRDYPSKVVASIPMGTAWFLENLGGIALACRILAVLAIIAAVLVVRQSRLRDAAGHSIALIASLLSYVAFVTVLMSVVMFFVLPHAKAAI